MGQGLYYETYPSHCGAMPVGVTGIRTVVRLIIVIHASPNVSCFGSSKYVNIAKSTLRFHKVNDLER